MKIRIFLILIFCFVFSSNASQDSTKVSVCKSMAEGMEFIAKLKQDGKSEDEIRKILFKINQEQLAERSKYVTKEFIDAVLIENLENLIFLFDKSNISKTPSQMYTIKFNKCFKGLMKSGY
jgi:hypothetical protein